MLFPLFAMHTVREYRKVRRCLWVCSFITHSKHVVWHLCPRWALRTHFSLQRDAAMQTCSRARFLLQTKCFHYTNSAGFACVCIDTIHHEEFLLVRADGRWCWSSWRQQSGDALLYLVQEQEVKDMVTLWQIQKEHKKKMQVQLKGRQ